jgi:hypothetical protein
LGGWRGEGCCFRAGPPRPGPLLKQWEQLAVIHGELRETEASYGKELVRFGQTEAPRLDRLRERLASVGRQIGSSAAGSHDSGEMNP